VSQPDALLDTNVLLRHVLQDHPDHSPRATALFSSIEQGERAVRIADTVVFEAAFTLEKVYRVPREAIRDALQPILDLPSVVLPGKRLFAEVFSLYVANPGLSFADCYHLSLTKQLGLRSIVSFDQRLGSVSGVTRSEP
jgi:predicted nucleic acid-binding protein